MVNPKAGHESERVITRTDEPKKIMVAGAGPAGCEFAINAAKKGHKVTLFEKENYLGGQVFWAAESTRKPELMNLFRYYNTMLHKLGVPTRLGVELTPEMVKSENPDLVVVATGAAPFEPPIDAVNMPNVVQAWDVLKGVSSTGRRVVVVGGGSVGLETAVYLASIGTISPEQLYFLTLHSAESPETLKLLITKGTKEVTVLEMASRFGQDVGPSTRWVLMKDLKERGVKLIGGATMKEIGHDHVVYTDANGNDVEIPADTVVLAMGARPEKALAESLKETGAEVALIGDCAKVGRIGDAVEEGFKLAQQI
jgi:2,4-dienoyl-CoA reductase (NADPH2)